MNAQGLRDERRGEIARFVDDQIRSPPRGRIKQRFDLRWRINRAEPPRERIRPPLTRLHRQQLLQIRRIA